MTTTTTGPSQCDRIWERLHHGPICSQTFYGDTMLTHRLAARIYDLRRRHGVDAIASRPCANRWHNHTSAAVEYYLPAAEMAGQGTLPL